MQRTGKKPGALADVGPQAFRIRTTRGGPAMARPCTLPCSGTESLVARRRIKWACKAPPRISKHFQMTHTQSTIDTGGLLRSNSDLKGVSTAGSGDQPALETL